MCKDLPQDVDRRHRLQLALISCLPSVPFILLPRALSAVKDAIDNMPDNTSRKELIEALFREIVENIGDAEKEYVVHWWNERRAEWSVAGLDLAVQGGERSEMKGSEIVSRL